MNYETQRREFLKFAAGLAGALGTSSALAQAYPSRLIKVISPFSAPSDQVPRAVAMQLAAVTGHPVILDAIPGGTGIVGTSAVINAPADGHMLLAATNYLTNSPLLGMKLPYDADRDLVPIVLTATCPHVLSVSANSSITSVEQLIAQARLKPGAQSYATSGVGTMGHLYGEYFKSVNKIDVLFVPYKGSATSIVDVITQRVTWSWDVVGIASEFVRSGKLRALAVTGSARSPLLPEVPSMSELGFPDFQSSSWFGIMARVGTPQAILDYLNTELNKALKQPELIATLGMFGFTAEGGSPERFSKFLKGQTERWGKVVREARIRIE